MLESGVYRTQSNVSQNENLNLRRSEFSENRPEVSVTGSPVESPVESSCRCLKPSSSCSQSFSHSRFLCSKERDRHSSNKSNRELSKLFHELRKMHHLNPKATRIQILKQAIKSSEQSNEFESEVERVKFDQIAKLLHLGPESTKIQILEQTVTFLKQFRENEIDVERILMTDRNKLDPRLDF